MRFTIDEKTGLLSGRSSYKIGKYGLRCLTTDPWGRYLYASPCVGKAYIYIFKIINGTLTEIKESPYVYCSNPDFVIECLTSLSRKL
jgi:hypothetical protein